MLTYLFIQAHRPFRVMVRERVGRGGCRAAVRFLDPAARAVALFVDGKWAPGGLPAADLVVHPSQLHPDAPLTPAEARELDRLDGRLAGQDRPLKDDYDRFEALRFRSILHPAHANA